MNTVHDRTKDRSGGGGAWRAFVHIKHKGVQITKESAKSLANEYRSLLPDEKVFYENLGSLATAAHRASFPAFGAKSKAMTKPSALEPGHILPDGVIVAADEVQRMNRLELIPFSSRNFYEDIQTIKTRYRQTLQEQRKAARADLSSSTSSSADLLTKMGDVVSGVPAAGTFAFASQVSCGDAAASTCSSMPFYPPCSAIAQAGCAPWVQIIQIHDTWVV